MVLVDGDGFSYLAVIERARAAGQGALVVPEISLTSTDCRLQSLWRRCCGVIVVFLVGERFDQWIWYYLRICPCSSGCSSLCFICSVANLGLGQIDEEREGSYKQDSMPRHHAREAAARMAKERGCALVLGLLHRHL